MTDPAGEDRAEPATGTGAAAAAGEDAPSGSERRAGVSAPAVGPRVLFRAATARARVCAWYGDSAYGTGELRDAIKRAGDEAVIKPKPVTPAVAGGFTVDDFTVDEGAGTVTCPAGQTRPISPTGR